jgi:predicted DNA-binding transcriptional regulator AlpA
MMEPSDPRNSLCPREWVAAMLGVSIRTLIRMEQKGEIQGKLQISGNRVGYRRSAIEQFISQRENAPA